MLITTFQSSPMGERDKAAPLCWGSPSLYQPQSTCGYASSRTRLMLSTRIGYRNFGVEKEKAAELTPLMGGTLRNQLRPVPRPPLATVAKPCRASCPKKPCEIEGHTVVCGRCGVLPRGRFEPPIAD